MVLVGNGLVFARLFKQMWLWLQCPHNQSDDEALNRQDYLQAWRESEANLKWQVLANVKWSHAGSCKVSSTESLVILGKIWWQFHVSQRKEENLNSKTSNSQRLTWSKQQTVQCVCVLRSVTHSFAMRAWPLWMVKSGIPSIVYEQTLEYICNLSSL